MAERTPYTLDTSALIAYFTAVPPSPARTPLLGSPDETVTDHGPTLLAYLATSRTPSREKRAAGAILGR